MKLSFIGDIAFNGFISEEPASNLERFSVASKLLQESSLVFANLEVPVRTTNTPNEYKNQLHYSLREPTAELLKMLNIKCVSLANNHIYDYKMAGLMATVNLLDELGISHTGAGWKPEQVEPVIIQTENLRQAYEYLEK